MNCADNEWNEIRMRQSRIKWHRTSADIFSKQANVDQLVKSVIERSADRIKDQLAALSVPAGSTVLDIGAGPGTLAVPLAARGCRVTVVEPSLPMKIRRLFEKRA